MGKILQYSAIVSDKVQVPDLVINCRLIATLIHSCILFIKGLINSWNLIPANINRPTVELQFENTATDDGFQCFGTT